MCHVPSLAVASATEPNRKMTDSQKRKAAIDAMTTYLDYAANQAQEIADEAAAMMIRFGAHPVAYPIVSKYLALRNEADRLRKEVQP